MPLLRPAMLALLLLSALPTASVCAQPPTDTSTKNWGEGNVYLAEVLATLERRPCIAARLRQQVRLDKHTLIGSGQYRQQGTGTGRRSHWEMQTQVADQTASILQVFDGKYLWTDRRLPSGRQIRRLDVARLQASQGVRGFGQLRTQTTGASLEALLATGQGRGGLAQLLGEAFRQFEFAAPQATQLNGLPVDALVGRWRKPRLKKIWPALISKKEPEEETVPKEKLVSQEEQPSPAWPAHLPHHVLLLIGKSDLFPYVVEYRRIEDAPLAGAITGHLPCRDPLLRYELFEVQFAAAIDSRLFQFKPGAAHWTDETSLMISRSEDPSPPNRIR